MSWCARELRHAVVIPRAYAQFRGSLRHEAHRCSWVTRAALAAKSDTPATAGADCGRSARAADRESIDAQRRLSDANRHALPFLAAGADPVVELEVVADHR